ncbi:hypothetical protein I5U90_05690 [Stenotrophomonas maltophilia]|nr:hypothetical protein [Stenotrophomonas maltophilia]
MSNDNKTLADVQPGGMVRLGDQAERARFEVWCEQHNYSRSPAQNNCGITVPERYGHPKVQLAWEAWQAALSAQPSPGGQDVLTSELLAHAEGLERMAADDRETGLSIEQAIEDGEGYTPDEAADIAAGLQHDAERGEETAALLRKAATALAARQPVEATEQSYNSGGIELTACQLHEALLMAGSPELDVPFEDRSLVRIFWAETGHSGPGLYCECVGAEEEGCILLDGTAPAIGQPEQGVDLGQAFQAGVAEWMGQCFLPSLYSNMTERGDRLLEEVLELLQAHGYDKARVPTLVDYVFGRPVGDPAQEVGGVMVTLAGYCWVAGLDMHAAGDAELARINHPEVMAKIRAKQEAKNALHFDTPLPGNAAAPIPAQAVDLANVIDHIAQQWDGCSYDAVGETIDVGQAIRAAGKRLIDSHAVGNGK